MALGLVSLAGTGGAVISPLAQNLPLPFLFFGIFATVIGILMFILPK